MRFGIFFPVMFSFLCLRLAAGSQDPGLIQDTVRIDTSEYIPDDIHYNLIIASFYGYNTEILRLLNRGADPNARTWDGITPLMYAVQNGDLTAVQILVLNGADVNRTPDEGASPLIAASRYDFADIAGYLLQCGARVNHADSYGATALHYAAGYYYYDLCELLLSFGADPESRDRDGTTPLMAAVYGGNPDVVTLLAGNGANINSADNEGFTSLMVAAQNGDTAMIRILTDNHAGPDLVNRQGYSALALAIKNGFEGATTLLLDLGATTKGMVPDPSSLALMYGHKELARFLAERVASPGHLPAFNTLFVTPGINTSFNDIMAGGEAGVSDSRYKINLLAGYQVRLFAKRILIELDEQHYAQFWENRSLAYAGLSRDFRLGQLPDNTIAGFTAGILGGYTFGRNYRGSENSPPDEWKIIPVAGLWWGGQRFRLDITYTYVNFDTFKVSPSRITIGLKYTYSLQKRQLREKTITWY